MHGSARRVSLDEMGEHPYLQYWAIVLYVCCVMDVPWLYWAFEIFVMTSLYFYMRHTHETFCKEMTEKLEDYG